MSRHVDHELAQAIALSAAIRRAAGRAGSPSSTHVAFAAHFRALMEFFHDGRPGKNPDSRDFSYSELLPQGIENPFSAWSDQDRARFDVADAMLGHLSKRRDDLGTQPEWGTDLDWSILEPKIAHFFNSVPDASHRFPVAWKAWRAVPSTARTMTLLQRLVLLGYLIGIVACGVVWTPWNEVLSTAQADRVRPLEFAPLYSPPVIIETDVSFLGVELDWLRLLLHLVVLSLAFGVMYRLAGDFGKRAS